MELSWKKRNLLELKNKIKESMIENAFPKIFSPKVNLFQDFAQLKKISTDKFKILPKLSLENKYHRNEQFFNVLNVRNQSFVKLKNKLKPIILQSQSPCARMQKIYEKPE